MKDYHNRDIRELIVYSTDYLSILFWKKNVTKIDNNLYSYYSRFMF